MRLVGLLAAVMVGCQGPEVPKADPTAPVDPDLPPTEPVDTTPPGTSTEDTDPPTVPETPLEPTLPPVPCPFPVDPVAVETCAEGNFEALLGGVGYEAIQLAIDDSRSGDTILVCPGTWMGELVVPRGRTLGAADPTPGATIIDGEGTWSLLRLTDASAFGLTLRDGVGAVVAHGKVALSCIVAEDNVAARPARLGGAVRADGELTVTASAFARNEARVGGGAIEQFWGESLVVEDTLFLENSAGDQGGAIHSTARSTVLRRSVFADNRADSGGGGLSTRATGEPPLGIDDTLPHSMEIEDSTFTDNRASYDGGALSSSGGWGEQSLALARCTFTGNRAGYEGGALSLGGHAPHALTLTESTFTDNQADYAGGAVVLGGAGGSHSISGSTFTDNQADYAGGALSLDTHDVTLAEISGSTFTGSAPQAVSIGGSSATTVAVSGSSFVENEAGLFLDNTGGRIELSVIGSTFARNVGPWRGAIATNSSSPETNRLELHGTTFEDNAGSGPWIGGMMTLSSGSPTEVVASDLVVRRNSGTDGALSMRGIDAFDCTSCDFGTGADQNLPADVTLDGVQQADLPLDFSL